MKPRGTDRCAHEPRHRFGRALCLAISIAFCAVGALAAAASARSHAPALCTRYRCKTLAANAQVQVLGVRTRGGGEPRGTFARWLASGRVTALGDSYAIAGSGLEMLALAGRYVAYTLGTAERYPGNGRGESVLRLNVQTGVRTKVGCTAEPHATYCGIAPHMGVSQIAATPSGAIAWIVAGADGMTQPDGIFEMAPDSEQPVRIAESATIERGSLAAIAGHLYWLEAGVPHAAAID